VLAPDFSSGRPRTTRSAGSRDGGWLFGAGLLLSLAIYSAVSAQAELAEAQSSVARARAEADVAAAKAGKLQAGPEQARLLRATLSRAAAPPRVLAALESLLPGDVRLDGISITYGSALELDLRIVAKSPAAYDMFLERLSASPQFTKVIPGEENREGEVQSGLHVTWVGGVS
jgi:hypothetical protein